MTEPLGEFLHAYRTGAGIATGALAELNQRIDVALARLHEIPCQCEFTEDPTASADIPAADVRLILWQECDRCYVIRILDGRAL